MVHDPPVERDVALGRWPIDTALQVISALEGAGIPARAERTGGEVEVRVPHDERDRAHRVLAPVRQPPSEQVDRPLLAERMRRLARPLGLVLAVLIAITLSYEGPVIGAVVVAIAVAGVAAFIRNRVRDRRTYGD